MLVNLRRAPAAAPTKAVLGAVCRFGQRSVTDASLSRSHCIVFRHVMLLSWFVLGSFCVSVTVSVTVPFRLEQHPQAGFRLGIHTHKKKKKKHDLPDNATGFLVMVCCTLTSCPIGILNIGLATTFQSGVRKYSNGCSFKLEQFVPTQCFSYRTFFAYTYAS